MKPITKTLIIPVDIMHKMIAEYFGEEVNGYSLRYVEKNYPFDQEYQITVKSEEYTKRIQEYDKLHCATPLQSVPMPA
jgi:hypothetical protein